MHKTVEHRQWEINMCNRVSQKQLENDAGWPLLDSNVIIYSGLHFLYKLMDCWEDMHFFSHRVNSVCVRAYIRCNVVLVSECIGGSMHIHKFR